MNRYLYPSLTRALILMGFASVLAACGGGGDSPTDATPVATNTTTNAAIIDLAKRQATKRQLLRIVAGQFSDGCLSSSGNVMAPGGGPIIVEPGLVTASGISFDPITPTAEIFAVTRGSESLIAVVKIPNSGGEASSLLVGASEKSTTSVSQGSISTVCGGKATEFSATDFYTLFRGSAPDLPVTMTKCMDVAAVATVSPTVIIAPGSITLGPLTISMTERSGESLYTNDAASTIRQSGTFVYTGTANGFVVTLAVDDGNRLRSASALNSSGSQFISCSM